MAWSSDGASSAQFRGWVAETQNVRLELAETAFRHANGGMMERSYRRIYLTSGGPGTDGAVVQVISLPGLPKFPVLR